MKTIMPKFTNKHVWIDVNLEHLNKIAAEGFVLAPLAAWLSLLFQSGHQEGSTWKRAIIHGLWRRFNLQSLKMPDL